MKDFLKRLFCRHDKYINRWHYTHGPAMDPIHIEIELKCKKCGKLFYTYIFDVNKMERFAAKWKDKEW